MDRNTITGFLLIGAIIVIFTIINRPTKEQIAEQQRLRDSIQMVELERLALEEQKLIAEDKSSAVSDELEEIVTNFFSTGSVAQNDSLTYTADSSMVVESATPTKHFPVS